MNQLLRFFGRDLSKGTISLLVPDQDVAIGEALLAMTTFAGYEPELSTGDRGIKLLLERCYEILSTRGRPFSAEDFALYFLSRLFDRVEAASRSRFRAGAVRYLFEKRNRLSLEFARLADDARVFSETPATEQAGITQATAAISTEDLNEDFGFGDDKRDEFVFDFGRPKNLGMLVLT